MEIRTETREKSTKEIYLINKKILRKITYQPT